MAHHNEKPVDDAVRSIPSKKNTKKWCKGKVGRPHRLSKRLSTKFTRIYTCGVPKPHEGILWGGNRTWVCYHEEFCEVCGKVTQWFLKQDDCPAYQDGYRGPRGVQLSSSNAPY